MSPTEFELRAALRDGEGEGLDPDAVVSRALAVRRQRRVRVLGGVSAAAVVAALGLIGGVVLGGGGNSHHGGSVAADAGGRNAPGEPALGQLVPSAEGAGKAIACPPVPPSALTSTGKASQGTGPLFGRDVRRIVVCEYGLVRPGEKLQASTVLTGSPATALAQSVNSAPTQRPQVCPQYETPYTRQYALIAQDSTGKTSPPVLLTLADNPCQTVLTDGTNSRVTWHPPAAVGKVFLLTPGGPRIQSVPASPAQPAPSS
jgi:hypothetical protein